MPVISTPKLSPPRPPLSLTLMSLHLISKVNSPKLASLFRRWSIGAIIMSIPTIIMNGTTEIHEGILRSL